MSRIKRYTLIELLVTLTTIVFMVSILVPVLNKALVVVRSKTCQNNFKEISMGMYCFNNDYGRLPSPRTSHPTWFMKIWQWKLKPYIYPYHERPPGYNSSLYMKELVGADVFLCPDKVGWPTWGWCSYGMNSFHTLRSEPGYYSFEKGIVTTKIKEPSINALCTEVGNDNEPSVPSSARMYGTYKSLRHDSMDNILFADGHIEPVELGGLNWNLYLE